MNARLHCGATWQLSLYPASVEFWLHIQVRDPFAVAVEE